MTNNRVRSYGIHIGILPAGKFNAVTDVPGVKVGQVTLEDDACGMHTGVTAILPHGGNVFQEKVPAGVFVGNGFGKSAGIPQINELGTLETPIVLTNTLSVAAGIEGLLSWTLEQPGNEAVKSVNAFVGETNDGRVNDIRARFVSPNHVIEALRRAESGPVEEGCCGAGTGTVAFGFKAGIGTASRKLPESLGGWTVGVIVQANFGGFLTVKGVEVGRQLGGWSNEKLLSQAMPAGWAERVKDAAGSADGSIMMIAATDAPLTQRSLERLAERAFMGMTRTGGIASNGSGDFALAFSTAPSMRVRHEAPYGLLEGGPTVRSDDMTPLFMAANFVILALMRHKPAPWALVLATIAGFTGVTIVLQPSFNEGELIPALICLGVSLLDLVIYWQMKELGDMKEPSWRIVFYFTLFGTIAGLIACYVVEGGLHMPNAQGLVGILGMGLCATLGQICTTRSYAYGNMLLSSCLGFSAIPFSVIISFFWFGESVTAATLTGAAVILCSGMMATVATKRTEAAEKAARAAEEAAKAETEKTA